MCGLLILGAILQDLAVVGQIDTGTSPAGMAILPAGDKLYVADEVEGRVHVVDLLVGATKTVIPMGPGFGARRPLIGPGSPWVWVQSPPSRVAGINPATDAVERLLGVPYVPSNMAFSASGDQVIMAVASSASGLGSHLTIVDAMTGTTQGLVPIPKIHSLNGLAVTPDGARAVITRTSPGASSLLVVDLPTLSLAAEVPLAAVPLDAVLDNGGTRVLVACWGGKSLEVVDLPQMQVVKSIPLGTQPFRVRISPDGKHAWVLGEYPGRLVGVRLDTLQVVAAADIPGAQVARNDFALRPDGKLAVATAYTGTVYLVHTDPAVAEFGDVAADLATATAVTDVLFDPTGTYAYVAERTTGSVYVLYVSAGLNDLSAAIESTLGEIFIVLADPSIPAAQKADLQKAVDQLQGNAGGSANNGALVKISNGQLEAGLAKVAQAISYLAKVTAIDTTPWQAALAEGARVDTQAWLLSAQEILGAGHPAVMTAWSLYDEGISLESQGQYRNAVLKFKDAVRATNAAL